MTIFTPGSATVPFIVVTTPSIAPVVPVCRACAATRAPPAHTTTPSTTAGRRRRRSPQDRSIYQFPRGRAIVVLRGAGFQGGARPETRGQLRRRRLDATDAGLVAA